MALPRSELISDLATPGLPVLKINDHATGGRRTKDILGGPKGWGPKKKVANAEIYVIFEVFAFCGGRTKTDFKDRAQRPDFKRALRAGLHNLFHPTIRDGSTWSKLRARKNMEMFSTEVFSGSWVRSGSWRTVLWFLENSAQFQGT